MKRKKWFCLLLSAALLFAGCGGKGSSEADKNTGSGVSEGRRYDYEMTEETVSLPLQEGETILWAQYLEGERVWFLKNEAEQLLCYHEDKGERELLLERVPAAFTGCSLYTDGENYYACRSDKLTVLDAVGKEKYALNPEGWISNFCVSREGSIVFAIYDDVQGGVILKTLDVESGTLSGGSRLSDCFGIGTGTEGGVLVIDRIGAYDLDMESGEKSWHMKWNGTSYIPTYEKYFLAARIGEDGTLERIERDFDRNYYLSYLRETHPEEAGKIPIVFRVLFADVGLKKIVTKFNQENEEYHVFLEDKGEEYGWDLWTRTDLEIATGKGPDLIAADAVTDMRVLAEKGGLENLEPYLAQAGMGREDYHQETFQSQGMENGIYSAGYEIRIRSLCLREEFLDSSGQTDIKTLLDNLEGYEGQAIFNKALAYTPANLMCNYFFQMSEDFYGMVDWEGKTCDFSGELWEQILRVSSQYGLTERNGEWEEIADGGYIDSFSDVVYQEQRIGPQGMVLAGYPSEEGMVNWLQMESVAINANSANKEGAWQFIRFLLDEENQALVTQGFALPVHEGALEASVEEYLYDYYYNTYTSDGRHIIRPELPEGIEEKFWEGIANAKPASYRTGQVIDIIKEEAEFYFMGDKTIEEVSAVIENRVKLYLAELE